MERERLGLPPWAIHRKVAVPPFSEAVVNYYTVKLAKLLMADFPIRRAQEEIQHCREVLAQHHRMREMELSNRELHDHQNSSAVPPPDQIR
jgi:hypothetical protein